MPKRKRFFSIDVFPKLALCCVSLSLRETVEPEDLLRVRKRERLLKLEAVEATAMVVLWSRSVLSIPSLEVLNTIRKQNVHEIGVSLSVLLGVWHTFAAFP